MNKNIPYWLIELPVLEKCFYIDKKLKLHNTDPDNNVKILATLSLHAYYTHIFNIDRINFIWLYMLF